MGLRDGPQNFIFALEASLLGQIFISRTIPQPRTLSADIPAARRGLFANEKHSLAGKRKLKPFLSSEMTQKKFSSSPQSSETKQNTFMRLIHLINSTQLLIHLINLTFLSGKKFLTH